MYRVPQAGPWWPAVGAPLERGVRQHRIVARVRGDETREPALKTRLLDRGGMVELRQLRPVQPQRELCEDATADAGGCTTN